MSDLFESYKKGIDRLLETMGKEHTDFNRAYAQRNRLIENFEKAELHGDDSTRKADRNEILYNLDRIALDATGKLFHEFYELDQAHPSHKPSSTSPPPAGKSNQQELPDDYLSSAHNYITSACNYITAMHQALQDALLLFSREGDIWPLECQDVISAFQKHMRPHMPENLTLSSLEGKLFFVSEQVHDLTQRIDNFNPYGREKSAKARNIRREIREKLLNFPQCLTLAIEHLNMIGESLDLSHRCVLEANHEKNKA